MIFAVVIDEYLVLNDPLRKQYLMPIFELTGPGLYAIVPAAKKNQPLKSLL
jgi:hypothetical protein